LLKTVSPSGEGPGSNGIAETLILSPREESIHMGI